MTKKRKTVKKKIDNKKIEELEKEISNSKEQYIRLLAEWENYRKRTTKEKSMSIEYGKEVVISKILPILDDFERAKKNTKSNNPDEGYLLIYQKLFDALEKEGLKKITNSKGSDFDVNQHEAISQIPINDKKLKGKIVEEIEPGYELNEKIIRFAKVVIGK